MESKNYKNWIAILDVKTCYPCRSKHGQIYGTDEYIFEKPPLHVYCRCVIRPVRAKAAGTATNLKRTVLIGGLRISEVFRSTILR